MALLALIVIKTLVDKIWFTVNALLPMHKIKSQENKLIKSPDIGYVRLQHWVFTQGFALVKKSSCPKKSVL